MEISLFRPTSLPSQTLRYILTSHRAHASFKSDSQYILFEIHWERGRGGGIQTQNLSGLGVRPYQPLRPPDYTPKCPVYLFLQEAVEDEDEHALEGVEDGEEVGRDHRGVADEEEAEGPGKAQQAEQREGAHHPRPEGQHARQREKNTQTPSAESETANPACER